MGSNSSKPADPSVTSVPTPAPSSSGSACPVKHTNSNDNTGIISKSACPIPHGKKENETKASNESACPVKQKDGQVYKNPSVFNVSMTKKKRKEVTYSNSEFKILNMTSHDFT